MRTRGGRGRRGKAAAETTPIRQDRAATVRFAHQILGMRRVRQEMLGDNLFSDPAWDLLLHLYVQTAAGRQVAVSGLCQSAQVRPTTGLRWINLLADAGLLAKTDDPDDARRVFVGFARGGEASMHRLLARAMTETGVGLSNED